MHTISKMTFKTLITALFLFSSLHAGYYLNESWNDYKEIFDRCWVDADYLYWKVQDSPSPIALVNEGPTYAPVVGAPGTTIILGDKHISNHWRSGGRFTAGYWFDRCRTWGIDASYFFLPNEAKSTIVSSSGLPGSPFFGTPYINAITGVNSSNPISNSITTLSGGAFANVSKLKLENNMQNAELNALMSTQFTEHWHIGILAGFRYWNYNEDLSFTTDSPYIAIPTDIFRTTDKFDVRNNFYGGQIGIGAAYECGWFFFDIKGKVALGGNCANTHIQGYTVSNDFNTPVGVGPLHTYVGGIYALSTNIGNHKKTLFCSISEVNADIGFVIFENLSLRIGYNFIYVSNMMWSTQQISKYINPSQSVAIMDSASATLVGKPRPSALNNTNSLNIQGVNVGLSFGF